MAKTSQHHLEAVKTYVEQTKLLVTLASVFMVAPAVTTIALAEANFFWFACSEVMFVLSVLLGYIVFGSIAGSQDEGDYNVYRRATCWSSLAQFFSFLVGICAFFMLVSTGAPSEENHRAISGLIVPDHAPRLPTKVGDLR